MKRYIKSVSAVLVLVLCILVIPQTATESFALYNDAKYDAYENMRDKNGVVKYTVPTLFKNDASYKNVKKYPLVVQDSVEYVPLEMFIGISKISVKTDLGNGNFYILNQSNDHFVSFDVVTNMAATHDRNPFYCETKIFYNTVYLPAKFTAELLGIKCEIYDNLETGVFALRFSDSSAKYSFAELVKMYSPIKIQPVPDEKEQETEKIGQRIIYLTFENCPNENTAEILDLLSRKRQKATFFCSYEGIKNYPALIRRMYVEGHKIGIYVQDEENLVESFDAANELLGIIIKNKTRLLRCGFDMNEQTRNEVEKNGIKVWGYNVDAADTIYSSNVVYERIVTRLETLEENRKTRIAAVRFTSSANARRALSLLLDLINGQNQLSVVLPNEATAPIYN